MVQHRMLVHWILGCCVRPHRGNAQGEWSWCGGPAGTGVWQVGGGEKGWSKERLGDRMMSTGIRLVVGRAVMRWLGEDVENAGLSV